MCPTITALPLLCVCAQWYQPLLQGAKRYFSVARLNGYCVLPPNAGHARHSHLSVINNASSIISESFTIPLMNSLEENLSNCPMISIEYNFWRSLSTLRHCTKTAGTRLVKQRLRRFTDMQCQNIRVDLKPDISKVIFCTRAKI